MLNFRVLGNDGIVYEVPEENVPQALQYGTLYDSQGSFDLFNPQTGQTQKAPKKELNSYFSQGFQLNTNVRRPVRMLDPNTLELFDVPYENLNLAWQYGARPVRGGREPEFDNTGEGFALSGKKTWTEALGNFWESPTEFVPFLNAISIFDSYKVLQASSRLKEGRATPEERALVERYTADAQRETTWGYKVLDTAMRAPAFAIEFLTGGSIIKGAATRAVSSAGRSAVIREGFENKAKEIAQQYATVAPEVVESLFKTGARTSVDDIAKAIAKTSVEYNEETLARNLSRDFLSKGLIDSKELGGVASSLAWLVEPAEEGVLKLGREMLEAGKTKGVGEIVEEFGERALTATGELASRGAVMAAGRTLLAPQRAIDPILINMTPAFSLTADERGNAQLILADEGDGFGEAFVKGFGGAMIENFSESIGSSFIFLRATAGKAAKDYVKAAALTTSMDKIAQAVAKKLPGGTEEALKNARRMTADYVLGSKDRPGVIQQLGWDGYFGELGEEAVGEVLRQGLNLATGDKIDLPSLEDVSAMAVGFLLNPLALGFSAYDSTLNRAAKSRAETISKLSKVSEEAAASGIGVAGESVRDLEDSILDSLRKLADTPKGFFGKMMNKMWVAPVESRALQQVYQSLTPGQDGKTLAEAAGIKLSEASLPSQGRVSEQMFTSFLDSMANNLSVLTPEAREQVGREQVSSLLNFMGVLGAQDAAGYERMQALVKEGKADVELLRAPVSLPSGRRIDTYRLLTKMKPGVSLTEEETKDIRSALPFLMQGLDVDQELADGTPVEAVQGMTNLEPAFSIEWSDKLDNESDLIWTLGRKSSTEPAPPPDWRPSESDYMDVARRFGWEQDMLARGEVRAGATPSEMRAAVERRVGKIFETTRFITKTLGLSVDFSPQLLITGTRDNLKKAMPGFLESYGEDKGAGDTRLNIFKRADYSSGSRSKRISVGIDDLMTNEGLSSLVEESIHAITIEPSTGKLSSLLTTSDVAQDRIGLIPRKIQELKLLRSQPQQTGIKQAIDRGLSLLTKADGTINESGAVEFLAKYLKAAANVSGSSSAVNELEEDFKVLVRKEVMPLTQQDLADIGESAALLNTGGLNTASLRTAEAAPAAAQNVFNLLRVASGLPTEGPNAFTFESLPPGEPPSAAGPETGGTTPGGPALGGPAAPGPGTPAVTPSAPAPTSTFDPGTVTSEIGNIETSLNQMPEQARGVNQVRARLGQLKEISKEIGPELNEKTALKLANEITRLQSNTGRMDKNLEGVAQIDEAANRVKDQLGAAGYEFVDLVGKPYNEGLNAIADFKYDESLPPGTATITKVSKPQINRDGKMIQAAEIVVTQGPEAPPAPAPTPAPAPATEAKAPPAPKMEFGKKYPVNGREFTGYFASNKPQEQVYGSRQAVNTLQEVKGAFDKAYPDFASTQKKTQSFTYKGYEYEFESGPDWAGRPGTTAITLKKPPEAPAAPAKEPAEEKTEPIKFARGTIDRVEEILNKNPADEFAAVKEALVGDDNYIRQAIKTAKRRMELAKEVTSRLRSLPGVEEETTGADDVSFARADVSVVSAGRFEREAVSNLLAATKNQTVRMSDLTEEQIEDFGAGILSEPTILSESPDAETAARQQEIVRELEEVQAQNLRSRATGAGFLLQDYNEMDDVFEAGDEMGEDPESVEFAGMSANEDTFGQSLVAVLVSKFPEGREKERSIVDFFGFNPTFRNALRRPELNTEEAWAEYLENDSVFGKQGIVNRDLRVQTAALLRDGTLKVEDIYALASLDTVRYVAGEAVWVDETGKTSFKKVGTQDIARLSNRIGRGLGRINSEEAVQKMLEDTQKVLDAWKEAGESEFERPVTAETRQKRFEAAREKSAVEKELVSYFSNYFNLDPINILSGLYPSISRAAGRKEQQGRELKYRRDNYKRLANAIKFAISNGLKEGKAPAFIMSDVFSVVSRTSPIAGPNKPSYLAMMVSPDNTLPSLLTAEQEKEWQERVSVPERYRDTRGKTINAASRTNAVIRRLDEKKVGYSYVVGGYSEHVLKKAEEERAKITDSQGYDKAVLTDAEIASASRESWDQAIQTGGTYRLPFGVAASKDRLLLIHAQAPTGLTFADQVQSVIDSPAYAYVADQGRRLLALGVDPKEWFPSLMTLKSLKNAKADYDTLFSIQEALDRAYYRGMSVATPAQLVSAALAKKGKTKVETDADKLLVRNEFVNESKRSSSFMTPQVGIPENIPDGFGPKTKVLLIEDATYQSKMFPGDKGDRTDGFALWTRKGVNKLRNSMGSTYGASTTKGLHAGADTLFKESEAGLEELAEGWRRELGAEAANHPLVRLSDLVNALPEEQQPDIVRFVSATKLGKKEKAVRGVWQYTEDGSVQINPELQITGDQVFEVPTKDFGIVGKADKEPIPKRDTIPTQWLPSNLGTSPLMSSEFTEFVRLALQRNFEPGRINTLVGRLQSVSPDELLKMVSGAGFFPEITRKLQARVPLSVPEIRQLGVFIGNKLAEETGKLKVNRQSSINTPSFSSSFEGTAPETRVTDRNGNNVFRMSRVRANVTNARYKTKLEDTFRSEEEAQAAAAREILSSFRLYRDMLTVARKGEEQAVDFNSAYDRAVDALVALARSENVAPEALQSIDRSAQRDRRPNARDTKALLNAVSDAGLLDAMSNSIELHELDVDRISSDLFEVSIPGSLLMGIRVPSPGQSTIFVARLEGTVAEGQTNQMVLHPDDSARAGADFDIDTWYHFGPESQRTRGGRMERPEIGNDFMSNWIARLAQGMMRDEAGHRERYTKTDPEAYSELARKMLAEKLSKIDKPYYSWEVQGQLRKDNLAVKKVVGIFAAGVRLINALRVRGLEFSEVNGITDPAKLDRFEWKTPDGTTFVLGNVKEISPAAVSHFNTMLQMAVDNDKLLYMPALGITDANAGFITAMFLFNPDLMRGNATKEQFQDYLLKVLNYVQNNQAPRYEFVEKYQKRSPSYFQKNGRQNVRGMKDPLFKTKDWKQFGLLKHLADTLFQLGQVQNITTRPPKTFFQHLQRKKRFEDLSSPYGYVYEKGKGADYRIMRMNTRKAMFEAEDTVSPLFGNPGEMNGLYETTQFFQDPVATPVAEDFVREVFDQLDFKLLTAAEVEEEAALTRAEEILKGKNIKYDTGLQGAMEKVLMNIFVAETANREGATLTRNPDADANETHLNTRLIRQTNELKQQFPNNLFLQSIDAIDDRGIGPALTPVIALNVDPGTDGFAEMKKQADELPGDYLSDMLTYSKLRWGNDTRSRNGNLDAILPDSIQGVFALLSRRKMDSFRNRNPAMSIDLGEKYGRWAIDSLVRRSPGPMFSDGAAPVNQSVQIREEAGAPAAEVSLTEEELNKKVALQILSISPQDAQGANRFEREDTPWVRRLDAVLQGANNALFFQNFRGTEAERKIDAMLLSQWQTVWARASKLMPKEAAIARKAHAILDKAPENLDARIAELQNEIAEAKSAVDVLASGPDQIETRGRSETGEPITRQVSKASVLPEAKRAAEQIETENNKILIPLLQTQQEVNQAKADLAKLLEAPAAEGPGTFASADIQPVRPELNLENTFEAWPAKQQVRQRRDATEAFLERNKGNPFTTTVARAFLSLEDDREPYFSSKTVPMMRELAETLPNVEDADSLKRILRGYGIADDFINQIAFESNLPFVGIEMPESPDYVKQKPVRLDQNIVPANEQQLGIEPDATPQLRQELLDFNTDAETARRERRIRYNVASATILYDDILQPMQAQFREEGTYDTTLGVMDYTRAMNERTREFLHHYHTFFGVSGPRLIKMKKQPVFGVDPDTGDVKQIDERDSLDMSFWGRMSRDTLVKGPDGEVTLGNISEQTNWEWLQGGLIEHQFEITEAGKEKPYRFKVADMMIATAELRQGYPGKIKTLGRHIKIRNLLRKRGRAISESMASTPEGRQRLKEIGERLQYRKTEELEILLGYNAYFEDALAFGEMYTGGTKARKKRVDSETGQEYYDKAGQTKSLKSAYNEWLKSDMYRKLEKAGRGRAFLRLDVKNSRGFYTVPFIDRSLEMFYDEYLEMNRLYQQVTGEQLFFPKSGYGLPHSSGFGFMTADESDWIRRRWDFIRTKAKDATPELLRNFPDEAYDRVPKTKEGLAVRDEQRRLYREIQEYTTTDLRSILRDVQRSYGESDKQIERVLKRVTSFFGEEEGTIPSLEEAENRLLEEIENRLNFEDSVVNFMDADGALHRALVNKLNEEVRRYRETGKFENFLSADEAGLLKRLGDLIQKPAFRETSTSLRERDYETWAERYRNTGDLPRTMSPFEGLYRYASDMHEVMKIRSIFGYVAASMDWDGRPQAFFSFTEGFNPTAKDSPIPLPILIRMVTNMGQYLYREDNVKDFLYNPNKSIKEQIRNIADYLNRNSDAKVRKGGAGFVQMGSGMFKYVDQIYADRGDSASMLKKLATQKLQIPVVLGDRTRDLANYGMDLVLFQKILRVSFSAFFPLSAVESSVGYYGQFQEFFTNPKGLFGRGFARNSTYYMGLGAMRDALLNGHDKVFNEWLYRATKNGLMVNVLRDYESPVEQMEEKLKRLDNFVKGAGKIVRPFAKGAKWVGQMQTNYSKWLFGSLFPVFKVHSAYLLYNRAEQAYRESYGRKWTDREEAETLQWIARFANDGFGGQNWDQYKWASPKVMQIMNLLTFAPNWSLSSLNTQGFNVLLSKIGAGPAIGKEQMKQQLLWNTAIMSLALTAWPNILQGIIYVASRALGPGEDEEENYAKDVPFTWQNEIHRKYHVDVTPLIRKLPWYKGDPTEDRRFYVRWGKQMYEVTDGWFSDPWATLMRKTSTPVQMAIGLATGSSPGSDYPLPFDNQGLVGWFWTPKEGVFGSKSFYLLSHFVPFSVPSLVNMSDAAPLSLIAQVSKGMSAGTASRQLTKIFTTYGNPDSWGGVSQNPTARENLRALSSAIIEAAERNGYPTDKIIDDARGAVLRDLYVKLYEVIEKNPENPDQKELEKWAKAILRVNGTFRGVESHLKSKERSYGLVVELTPEQEKAVRDAFDNP